MKIFSEEGGEIFFLSPFFDGMMGAKGGFRSPLVPEFLSPTPHFSGEGILYGVSDSRTLTPI